MKKVVFIVSHLGSGSDYLLRILNNNPRCMIFASNNQYDHPNSLDWMFKYHKLKNHSGAIYGDHLLFNQSFSCKILYNYCKFIYLIRPPRQSLVHIVRNYSELGAFNYYRFRLRRICEMAKQTKNAIMITYDELISGKAFYLIKNYLKLAEDLDHDQIEFDSKNNYKLDESLCLALENRYEKYYYYLNNLGLQRP